LSPLKALIWQLWDAAISERPLCLIDNALDFVRLTLEVHNAERNLYADRLHHELMSLAEPVPVMCVHTNTPVR